MRQFGRILLWIGAFLLVFNFGAMFAAHRVGGDALISRHQGVEVCRAKQAVLSEIDRSAWTAVQQKVLADLCSVPKFSFAMFDPVMPIESVLLFLSVGGVFYLIAIVSGATKRNDSP